MSKFKANQALSMFYLFRWESENKPKFTNLDSNSDDFKIALLIFNA